MDNIPRFDIVRDGCRIRFIWHSKIPDNLKVYIGARINTEFLGTKLTAKNLYAINHLVSSTLHELLAADRLYRDPLANNDWAFELGDRLSIGRIHKGTVF